MEREHFRILLTVCVALFVSSYVESQLINSTSPPVPPEVETHSVEPDLNKSVLLSNISLPITRLTQKPDPFEDNVCQLPKIVGPCEASISRYYFDPKSGRCELFSYGGCQGNGNNFLTLRECQRRCTCSMPEDSGLCRANFRRFFYNPINGRCEEFRYGGCGGNSNNFMSLDECQETCIQDTPAKDVCKQDRDTGPCRASVPRYYFDSSCQCCKKFIYGGCDGNGNNFQTVRQCLNKCKGKAVLNN
ncbi:hypothetical protein ACJMK2_006345 [Sinanodonta woodiana]|uniref:BPTI/Kunitz inhibitor domain-containing protein n=1 Tax=Sinanodonta woodiana TaxID=1069815 RepID=A0ABD3VSV8_SINWO